MSAIEIVLLLLGAVVLTAGYVIPARKGGTDAKVSPKQEEQISELVKKEVEEARGKIEDIVDETVNYSVEKTERSMERLSNEKIMAINEYSDTVLSEIHKNHEEAVFLYDMLNNKHESLKTTVSEAGKTVAEVKQTLQDAQVTVKEAKESAESLEAVEAYQAQKKAEDAFSMQMKVAEEKALEEIWKASPAEADREEQAGFKPILAKPVENMDSVLKQPEAVVSTELLEEEFASFEKAQKASGRKKKDAVEPRKKRVFYESEELDRMSPDVQLNKGPVFGGNNNDRILEMHKAGKSNMAIAKELGLGIGEVKLVIDLYKGMGG